MLGSRTGLGCREDDLTYVRFPVGAAAKAAGVRPGDHIVAIDGIPLSRSCRSRERSPRRARDPDTDYALFGPILRKQRAGRVSTSPSRSPKAEMRDIKVRPASSRSSRPRARSASDADFARGRRPAAHRHLPVPAVRGVAPSPPQLARPDQLDPVAGDSADDRCRSSRPRPSSAYIAHVPRMDQRAFTTSATSCLLAGILLFPYGQSVVARGRYAGPSAAF